MSRITARRLPIRKILKVATRSVLVVFVLLMMASGLFLWRLSSGPISVGFLTPHLEELVESALPGVDVKVGDTVLHWDRDEGFIGLQVNAVSLQEKEERILLDIPSLGIDLAQDRLLRGSLAVQGIQVQGVMVRLHRDLEGRVRLTGIQQATPEPAGEAAVDTASAVLAPKTGVVAQILAQIMAAPDPDQPLTYLENLQLTDGQLVMDDMRRDFVWRGTDVSATIERSHTGATCELGFAIPLPQDTITARGSLVYDRGQKIVRGRMAFRDVRLTSIATATGITQLAAFPFIAGATVSLQTDDLGRLQQFDLQVESRSQYDDGVSLNVTCTSDVSAPDTPIAGEVTLTGVPLARLSDYWPQPLAPDARAWVVRNIDTGTVSAKADFRLLWRAGSLLHFSLAEFAGTLRYEGLTVHFLRPLPPLRNVAGRATFGTDGLKFRLEPAALSDLSVNDVIVEISGLSRKQDALAADLTLAGPVRTVLTLLTDPSLDLLAGSGPKPSQVDGSLTSRGRLDIPLRGTIDFDTISLRFEGDTEALRLADFYRDLDADFSRLDFVVDSDGMDLDGLAVVATTQLDFHWHESFLPSSPQLRRVQLTSSRLEKPLLVALNLYPGMYLQGTAGVNVDAGFSRDGSSVVTASVDLTASHLSWPLLAWSKEAGVPGHATAVVTLQDFKLAAVDSLRIQTGNQLQVEGDLTFDTTSGRLNRLALTRFLCGRTDLEELELSRDAEGWYLDVGGGSVDAVPLLPAGRTEDRGEGAEEPAAVSPPADGSAARPGDATQPQSNHVPAFSCRTDPMRRIYFGEDRYLQDVTVVLSRDAGGWQLMDVQGRTPAAPEETATTAGDAPATTSTPAGTPGRWSLKYDTDTLEIQTDNAGALAQSLDLLDGYRGGRLILRSTGNRLELPRVVHAKLLITQMIATEDSHLATLFKTDLISALFKLEKEGDVKLEEIEAELVWEQNRLQIIRAAGQSESLLITCEGHLDRAQESVEVEGTVVPRGTVNSLLGSIPLIGKLFHGGEGFMAAYYKVSGPIAAPNLSVNPLKTLTPTFLKDWFSNED